MALLNYSGYDGLLSIELTNKGKDILVLTKYIQRKEYVHCNRAISILYSKRGVGKHPNPIVSTNDGGGTWYPLQACQFLELDLKHHIHSSYEKSIIERTI